MEGDKQMNKELKFRIWSETDQGNEIIYLDKQECDNGLWFDAPKHIDKYHSIMQYTGFKDKNGKEIYEGDIIKYGNSTPDVVEWVDTSCGYEPFSDSKRNCGCCGGGFDPTRGEIIGNIYENPELILQQK